jgi:HPt (histidine-containing phosphotransfer) domain-containing protein
MHSLTSTSDPLYSTLGGDPDLGEIVELFVDEMPERISNLLDLMDSQQWEELRRAAHQLKGAAGSYGFGPISPAAAHLENVIKTNESDEEQIRQAVDELINLCGRAKAGSPE